MSALYGVAGVIVLGVVILDAVTTTVATTAKTGPLTRLVAIGMWRGLRRASRRPDSLPMVAAGPLVLLAFVGTWMAGTWAGWTLVFLSHPEAVLVDATGEPTRSISDVVYFAGKAIATLGTGDLRPNPDLTLLQVATPLASVNGLLLATLAITYLIPVISAVNKERSQSSLIHALGRTPQEMLTNAWDGESLDFLDVPLFELAREVQQTAQAHVSYPVLHFFPGASRSVAFAPNLAVLDEVLSLLEFGIAEEIRPHSGLVRTVRRSVDELLSVVTPEYVAAVDDPPPPAPLAPLEEAGIPVVSEQEYTDAVGTLDEHRRRMHGLVADGRWSWEIVLSDPGADT